MTVAAEVVYAVIMLAALAFVTAEAHMEHESAKLWKSVAIHIARKASALTREAHQANRHGRMLDRTVWVKKYEASRWEEAVVVAVSHKGALAVRRRDDPRTFWVSRSNVASRVRTEAPESVDDGKGSNA